MTTRNSGRHRAAVRAKTPLTVISDSVSTQATTMGRRTAVIAASSGLVVTMGLPVAADPMTDSAPEPSDVTTTQTLQSVPAPSVTAGVDVPQDVSVDFSLSSLTTVDTSVADATAAAAAAAEAAAVAARAEAAAARTAAATGASRSTTRTAAAGSDATASSSATAAASTDADEAEADSAPVPASLSGSAALEIGSRYIGTPYLYGGTSPSGFDCSGFVQYVYAQLGVSLPRTASAQAASGTRVSASEARPGDIVSFTGSGGVFHNGLYVGNGQMLDSPRTGKSIAVRDIWSSSITFTRVS